jgi:hypothetical protein
MAWLHERDLGLFVMRVCMQQLCGWMGVGLSIYCIRKIDMQGTSNVHNDGVGRADLI